MPQAEATVPEIGVAAVLMLALTAYALLGSADFGAGVWDLLSLGPRGQARREVIARAMGPVWEANHVWLIFSLILLFTAFPRAFAVLSTALFVPFHLVLLGIILRGAAFVFRWHGALAAGVRQAWATLFGGASVLTPFLLGSALGSASSGGIRLAGSGVAAPPVETWLHPFSLLIGGLTLSISAYLAAVYLTLETDGALRQDFRRGALVAAGAVALLAAAALLMMPAAAPHLWHGFRSRPGLPLLVTGAAVAAAAAWALWRGAYALARTAAAVEVIALLWGWGLAQWPYLAYPDLTVFNAAAPQPVLIFALRLLPVGLLVVLPSLWLLLAVFKR